MSTIEYFRAGVADIPAVIDMRMRFSIEFDGERQAPEKEKELQANLERYLQKALASGQYICWLARDGSEVVGAGGLVVREHPGNFRNPVGLSGYVMNMYTAGTHRRMGISTAILNHLQESGREAGIHFFELHATAEGEPVYVKNGFKQHNEPTYRKWTGDPE